MSDTRGTTQRISAEEIERQMQFCAEIRKMNEGRPGGPPLAYTQTYGCQQNEADSERLRGYLSEMGYAFTDSEARADVIVINTCAIRENAEKKVFGVVGQLVHVKEKNPDAVICLCGCMAQQEAVAEKLGVSRQTISKWETDETLPDIRQSKRLFAPVPCVNHIKHLLQCKLGTALHAKVVND